MEMTELIILSSLGVFIMMLIVFLIVYIRRTNLAINQTQSFVTDKELIEYVNNQPDKIVDSKMLMKQFGFSKFEANSRLRHLMTHAILRMLKTRNGLKSYYTLLKPIEKSYDLDLTDDPFMTIEDLMRIFKQNDYQVTLLELCLCTGLPLKVLIEEMKYFEKEGVVKCLVMTHGFQQQKVYTLCEPYRSNPDGYTSLKDANFELKEIYEKVRKS